MNFVTIDFETATSARDSPCALGLTFVKNWQIVETKYWLIKPVYYPHFDYFNMLIHGIKPQHVSDEPEFDVIWREVKPLIENQFLIAHNASFDFSVLRRTLDTYGLPYPTVDYACSYIFCKKIWEGLPAYDLKTLCKLNNISFKHHVASEDSKATAELVIKAFELTGVNSKEDLPHKLRTVLGKLSDTEYKPSRTRSLSVSKYVNYTKDLTKIVGDPTKNNPNSIFHGKVVVFTGTLLAMPRAEAQKIIADIGGILGNGITKSTNFLVVGQQDYRVVGESGLSNKQAKAMDMISKGAFIEIVSETEFIRNL